MTDVVIRPERPEDAAAARAVHIDAFPVPDGEVQSVESVLVDWLREDGDVLWPLTLVAERDGQIVGSVVCSRGTIDERDSVGLGPIGVCAAYQGKGIGTRLMEAVIEAAQASGECLPAWTEHLACPKCGGSLRVDAPGAGAASRRCRLNERESETRTC